MSMTRHMHDVMRMQTGIEYRQVRYCHLAAYSTAYNLIADNTFY